MPLGREHLFILHHARSLLQSELFLSNKTLSYLVVVMTNTYYLLASSTLCNILIQYLHYTFFKTFVNSILSLYIHICLLAYTNAENM